MRKLPRMDKINYNKELFQLERYPLTCQAESVIRDNIQLFRTRLKLAGYSNSSIHSYAITLSRLMHHFKPLQLSDVALDRVETWMNSLHDSGKVSVSYVNIMKCSLTKYGELVEGKHPEYYLVPRSIRNEHNCKVLDSPIIKALLHGASCSKHKSVLMVAYGAGLRAREIRLLKVSDLNFKKNSISVEGANARIIPMAKALTTGLVHYLDLAGDQKYLFEGNKCGEPMTERGLQVVPQKISQNLGLRETVTLGVLRNSFGTHLFEQGVDLVQIATLMGYSRMNSALKFAYIAKHKPIPLPIDLMG